MGEKTAISWTDHTFNPWWGCTRVSPACQHCYAETFAKRTGNAVWGKDAPRRFLSDKNWALPRRWNTAAEQSGVRARVFCASMADVFEDRRDLDDPRARLWDLISATPMLDWQLLTKRPENIDSMIPDWWLTDAETETAGTSQWNGPPNVWLGTTVEDQRRAEERLPVLVSIPAPVRFLSCEPLLGIVNLYPWLVPPARLCQTTPSSDTDITAINTVLRAAGQRLGWQGIDWVICGGESGPGHRDLDVDHARSVRDQCALTGVPFFFKQVGGQHPTSGGHLLDGVEHHDFPQVVAS